jgi:hypothetical protein
VLVGKLTKPATISTELGIPKSQLAKLGVVDVSLNADTRLFIDPMLLSESAHPEIAVAGARSYDERFSKIIKLLKASKHQGDVAWRAAERLFDFPEINWTCLGYGSSVRGSGFGEFLVATTLETASQIVAMGIEDVDLFMVLALFEEGIGPDRISDMTTNIVLNDLVDFTRRVNIELDLPTTRHDTRHGIFVAPTNPFTSEPLVLVPSDIVRDLPLACDWSDISRVVSENEQLRDRVNTKIGAIWASMTRRDKRNLRAAALRSKSAFEEMLAVIKQADPTPYDFVSDRNGEVFWAGLGKDLERRFPFSLSSYSHRPLGMDAVLAVVEEILKQFRDIVENKGIWKELWTEDGRPRKEKAAQRLFFVVAYAYCKANDLDITPEADAGNGPVDFKVSKGFKGKVVVEIKLSIGNVVHGYEKQLEVYKRAEDADRGIFLLIDVGSLGRKYADIQKIRENAIKNGEPVSQICYVDGTQKASASKRN